MVGVNLNTLKTLSLLLALSLNSSMIIVSDLNGMKRLHSDFESSDSETYDSMSEASDSELESSDSDIETLPTAQSLPDASLEPLNQGFAVQNLSENIILNIFNFFSDYQTFSRFALTCKHFREISKTINAPLPIFITKQILCNQGKFKALIHFLQTYPNTSCLHLVNINNVDQIIEILRQCPHLTTLSLSFLLINDEQLSTILSQCPNLTELRIEGCYNLVNPIFNCPNLSKLYIDEHLNPRGWGLVNPIFNCPNLVILNLVGLSMNDALLSTIITALPKLTSLKLELCFGLVNSTINCPNLISLNIVGCPDLVTLTINCPKLFIFTRSLRMLPSGPLLLTAQA